MKIDTYVERLSQKDPSRFWLNVKVVQIPWVEGRGQAVPNGSVVISILIRSGNSQNVGVDVRILFHVFNVFLKYTTCVINCVINLGII